MSNKESKLEVMRTIRMDSRIFYYYYKKVMIELKKQNWKRTNTLFIPYHIEFKTINITYDHEAFLLLQKMFKRIGWKISVKHFTYSIKEGGFFQLLIEKISQYELSK